MSNLLTLIDVSSIEFILPILITEIGGDVSNAVF